MRIEIKREKRYRRHKRVKAKIHGTAERPRLCVFRSAKHIYAQLIDDEKSKTLVSGSDREIRGLRPTHQALTQLPAPKREKGNIKEGEMIRTRKIAIAYEVGRLIAKKALDKKIEKVVFDRRGCAYHGRVKALAEGAREGGLQF